jgi:hypothetical protein
VRLKVWCLGVLEGLEIGFEELLGCAVEYFDGGAGVEGDVLHGVALMSAGLEDAMLHVDRRLAGHIVGMDRDVSLVASVFDPMDGAVMVSLGASHPDVAALTIDPAAGVADGPVVRCSGRIKFTSEHFVLAGHGISCDQVSDPVCGAGERIAVLGAKDGGTNGLDRLCGWRK